jgi:hypothetical protein
MLPGIAIRALVGRGAISRVMGGRLRVLNGLDYVFDFDGGARERHERIMEELRRALVRLKETLETELGSIKVKTNFPEVTRQLDQLHSDLVKRALVRAFNRTIEQARTDMSREIRKEFNITAAKVNAALRIERATFHDLRGPQATLLVPAQRGRSLNLINFGARQTRRGVSVQVKKGSGRKVIPGAFIANDGKTVFKRVGKARLPIKALQTIDIAQMFNSKKIMATVERAMREKFKKNFEHEASYYINKFNSTRAGRI